MAKKHQRRTHVSVRKKQEEAKKQAQRKAFYAKHKKQIQVGVIVAAVALVLLIVAVDYFYAPGGSMKMFMGNLIGAKENSIIRDFGTSKSPRYYDMGTMDTPEGYVVDEDYVIVIGGEEDFEQNFYFVAEDETAVIQNVYVSGVANKRGEEMIETLSSNSFYTFMTDMRTAQVGGHEICYIYTQANPSSENDTIFNSGLVIYVDALDASSVLVNCSSGHMALEKLPTEEEMLAAAEKILSCLTVN